MNDVKQFLDMVHSQFIDRKFYATVKVSEEEFLVIDRIENNSMFSVRHYLLVDKKYVSLSAIKYCSSLVESFEIFTQRLKDYKNFIKKVYDL